MARAIVIAISLFSQRTNDCLKLAKFDMATEQQKLIFMKTLYFWKSPSHQLKIKVSDRLYCTNGREVSGYTFCAESREGGMDYLNEYQDANLCCIGYKKRVRSVSRINGRVSFECDNFEFSGFPMWPDNLLDLFLNR